MVVMRVAATLVITLALIGCDDGLAPPPPNDGGLGDSGTIIPPPPRDGGTGATGGAAGMAGAGGGRGGAGGMAGAAGGAGGAGGVGGTGGSVVNQCNNQGDVDAITALAPTSARQVAAQCGQSCAVVVSDQAFLECVNPCIETNIPGLSVGCGACYDEFSLCLRKILCLPQCALNACTLACEMCPAYDLCFNQLEFCGGRNPQDCFDDS